MKEKRAEVRKRKKGSIRLLNRKWILLVLITTALLVAGACSVIMVSAKSMPLDRLKHVDVASTIYDVNNRPATKLGSTNKEYVHMEDVPSRKLIEGAFVAVEDRRFYNHHGVDFKGLMRAMVHNVLQGRKAEGGGTITMQVARNVILESNTKTYARKLKEVAVAWNLERKYHKKDILEAYLNFIYFGNDVQGIQMASKIYFGKDLTREKLEPQEAALLAALPKAPSTYNPYRNEEKALERRNLVLDLMAREGVISQEERDRLHQTELGVDRKHLKKYLKTDKYVAFKHLVMEEAKERYGISETELATGGYKIQTHLAPQAQLAMEKAFDDDALFQKKEELDGGATMIHPQTGGIAAIAGGREYKGQGYVLRSKEELKQPGSAIKPITVYAPAVQEKGYDEYSVVPDPPGFRIGNWQPKNFQQRYFGKLPLKQVLAKSLNVATAWLLENKVGRETAVEYATRMGLQLNHKDRSSDAGLALGGLTEGVNTIQMAQAYSPFANNGHMTDAHAIRKITRENREWKAEKEVERNQQVLTPKTAYYLTRMMHYNVQQGTGTSARLPDGRDVAGKTGTTQNSREAWFVGYTREYVMSAMVFNQGDGKVELSGGGYPAKIFRRVMAEALQGTQISRFSNPGVPEPRPPFQLKPVQLSASYDADQQVVRLKWNDYSGRLKYRVERSEEGGNWQAIGETSSGAYTDGSMVIPEPAEGLPGSNSGKKTYQYRVIAVDTVENKEAAPSNTAQIQLVSEPPPPEQPGDEGGDDTPGDEGGDPPEEDPGEPPETPPDDGPGEPIPLPDQGDQGPWRPPVWGG